ncbi:CPBP family intramembrane glutamic endopeptidase [Streptosporangium sp. CA-135522]|uniref:CPBP family intramembrane glutamic endopeptidase n=1 Tax=Streptosporangium sp. CA-135522 TaxID=3240072 RepID=UPI003D93D13D
MSLHRKGLLVFLLISFGVAWGWLFCAHLLLGLSVVNPLVQLPAGFAPAGAAVIVRRWVTKEGFGDAGLALRLRSGWSYYLVAWLGPLVLVAATAGLAAALGVWSPDLSPLGDLVPGLPGWASLALLMGVVLVLVPVYWGEEFGWTGYLRLRLFTDRPLPSVAATGIIWAVWHYPLAFLGYINFSNVALGLLVWTISLLFQETILAWLRFRSGSIWTASLAHSGNNMVFFLLTGLLLGGQFDETALTVLTAVPLAVAAAWIVISRQLVPARRSSPGDARRDPARDPAPAHRGR